MAYLPRSLPRRDDSWRTRDVAAPTRASALVLSPISRELPAVDSPRDCVIAYSVGRSWVLLVSYDAAGVVFEEFRTAPDRATPQATAKMLARVRQADAHRMRLIP